MKNLARLVILCVILSLPACRSTNDPASGLTGDENTAVLLSGSPLYKITESIKANLNDWTVAGGRELMQRHLMQLRLLDASGNWTQPQFAAIGARLLPENIDQAAAAAFVDRIATTASHNRYLLDFLDEASRADCSLLAAKFVSDGGRVIPDVVAYAFVLQGLTKAMYDDYTLIPLLQSIWKKALVDNNVRQYMELFDIAKLASVEEPMNRIVAYHQSGQVPPTFLRTILPVNILEAVLYDLRDGRRHNAAAGWYLMVNRPGAARCNTKTDACPTVWAPDGKGIEFGMPLPRLWADLYTVWNLAFVSHYQSFPYVYTKLLIPQVNDYQHTPKVYIYNRALALYVHLNWSYIGDADPHSSINNIDWKDESLPALFGKVNLQSALNYQDTLTKADPSWINWFNDLASQFSKMK